MNKRFTYLKRNGEASRPVSLSVAMSVAQLRVLPGKGPFHLTRNEVQGPERSRTEVLRRLRAALKGGQVGNVFQVFDAKGPVFRIREIQPAWKTIDTNGNAKADKAWSAAKAVFGNVGFLGAYVCKTIAGSGQMSQHSYGNALDIGAPTMDDLYRIWDYFVLHHDDYDIDHAIVDRKIWTAGQGTHAYTGERHYHVHIDFIPQYSGRCGVRP